jgi:hypothetical protein
MNTTESPSAAVELKALPADALATLADEYAAARAARLAADRAAEELKKKEVAASTQLIAQLRLQSITSIGGKAARATLAKNEVPHVKDWDAFYAHIAKTKQFDLLERRPGKLACSSRWEDGVEIPGVEKFPVYTITLSKV